MDKILESIYPHNNGKLIEVELDKEHFPFKLLAHEEKLKEFLNGKDFSPIHYRIGLTNACNLRCKFCNFHSENEKE